MNASTPPQGQPPAGDGPLDDLDRRLRAFFRSQVPSPWPRLRAPASITRGRGPLPASRLALAASVAALLAGGWLLGHRLPSPLAPGGVLQDDTAKVPPELRRSADHPAPTAGRPR